MFDFLRENIIMVVLVVGIAILVLSSLYKAIIDTINAEPQKKQKN